MVAVIRVDFVTLLFEIFASHPKNGHGTVDLFTLFLVGVHTSQLCQIANNSENVLERVYVSFFKSLK